MHAMHNILWRLFNPVRKLWVQTLIALTLAGVPIIILCVLGILSTQPILDETGEEDASKYILE